MNVCIAQHTEETPENVSRFTQSINFLNCRSFFLNILYINFKIDQY